MTACLWITCGSILSAAPQAAGAAQAAKNTYCAFEVTVRKPSGLPFSGVEVHVIGSNKVTYSRTTTNAEGVARLCDAPLEFTDIAVGFDVCGLVVVNRLSPAWPTTRRVYVTFEDAPCAHFVFPTTCVFLMRVRDERGNLVPGARFRGKPANAVPEAVSDRFGRIYGSVPRGGKIEGVVTRQGSEPEPVGLTCEDNTELKVVLRNKP